MDKDTSLKILKWLKDQHRSEPEIRIIADFCHVTPYDISLLQRRQAKIDKLESQGLSWEAYQDELARKRKATGLQNQSNQVVEEYEALREMLLMEAATEKE